MPYDSLSWWLCSLHTGDLQHSVRYPDAVGVVSRLTDGGQIPMTAPVNAAEKDCVEQEIVAGRLDERRVLPADRITQQVGA